MKIILCGYNWTGCKALGLLKAAGHEVFVFTHETKNCCADLEGLCIKWGIPYTTDKICMDNLPFIPDMICSIYYRYIIDGDVINVVNKKIFNLHPSLLPKYRGCSSLTWAMINGDTECGFTYHYIDERCDTGKIILQKKIPIEDFDTQNTLYNRVMFESMNCFLDVIKMVSEGFPGEIQTGTSSYNKRGCPFSGVIAENMDEAMRERFIRAMVFPPYPLAKYHDKEVASWKEYTACKQNNQTQEI